MKPRFSTLVFCTSYIAGEAQWKQRYRRWLMHHLAVPWDRALFCFIDDASPASPEMNWVHAVAAPLPPAGTPTLLPESPQLPLFLRFGQHLGRSGMQDYPGWWRSFLHSVVVARHYGCDKIVHIESDAYVLSRRMRDFIVARKSGWAGFWCPRWKVPETAIQVICEDQFEAFEAFGAGGWESFAGKAAELVIPFTEVVRDPHGNRYGEYRKNIPSFADFAVQVTPAHTVWFK